VSLPNSVVYGIEYPTSDYGFPAYGDDTACHSTSEGCGYDSLNIGLSDEPASPSVGTDPNPGTIFWDTTYGGDYCDNGAAGVGVFRLDSPGSGNNCWAPYTSTVEFNAVSNPAATITSPGFANVVAGTPFSFTVTTDGVPVPAVTKGRGKVPAGLTFTNGTGTATISGTAMTTDRNGTYSVVVRAVNGSRMKSKQVLTLTLSGGRS
jgi:Putative Ig domain